MARLAETAGYSLRTITVERTLLEARHLLPGCSPRSSSWMSELDNRRSQAELGLAYTPVRVYLEKLVASYHAAQLSVPEGYQRRADEVTLAEH